MLPEMFETGRLRARWLFPEIGRRRAGPAAMPIPLVHRAAWR